MIAAILTAEVLFWVFLLAGLLARYALGRRRLGGWLLRGVPLVDLALVLLVTADLAAGARPEQGHALAAVYLGFTVAFGRSVVEWADARFRHLFAGGPRPVKPAKGSRAQVRALWREWFRVLLGSAIAAVALLGMIAVEGARPPATIEAAGLHPCWSTLLLLGIITTVWFLAGPAFAGTGRPELDPEPARTTGDRR